MKFLKNVFKIILYAAIIYSFFNWPLESFQVFGLYIVITTIVVVYSNIKVINLVNSFDSESLRNLATYKDNDIYKLAKSHYKWNFLARESLEKRLFKIRETIAKEANKQARKDREYSGTSATPEENRQAYKRAQQQAYNNREQQQRNNRYTNPHEVKMTLAKAIAIFEFKGYYTKADVKKKYKELMMLHHPDKNLDNQELAKENSQKINEAKEILLERI
jgi:predicted transcriptional regulator